MIDAAGDLAETGRQHDIDYRTADGLARVVALTIARYADDLLVHDIHATTVADALARVAVDVLIQLCHDEFGEPESVKLVLGQRLRELMDYTDTSLAAANATIGSVTSVIAYVVDTEAKGGSLAKMRRGQLDLFPSGRQEQIDLGLGG
jgi:hypothetical protein